MGSNKADLILHPARMQIMMALAEKALSTSEIAGRLEGIPKSSIYRHLRALLEGGMLEVAETRPVKGVLEKFYRIAQNPHLSQDDLNGFTREDHLRYFLMFLAGQLQGFANYLNAQPIPDFTNDRVGYSEVGLTVTPQELDRLLAALKQALMENAGNPPADGRHSHQIAFVTFPIFNGVQENGKYSNLADPTDLAVPGADPGHPGDFADRSADRSG